MSALENFKFTKRIKTLLTPVFTAVAHTPWNQSGSMFTEESILAIVITEEVGGVSRKHRVQPGKF
jgi:hypothetical protein